MQLHKITLQAYHDKINQLKACAACLSKINLVPYKEYYLCENKGDSQNCIKYKIPLQTKVQT